MFDQYDARMKRLDSGFEAEGRYLETVDLWTDILSFKDKKVSLIGKDPFDTQYKYSSAVTLGRYLHADINIIVFSSGLIGLMLYITIYIFILRYYIEQKNKVQYQLNRFEKTNMKYIFLSFFSSAVLLSFSGGLNAISVRSTIFIVLGAILGHFNYLKNRQLRYAHLHK